MSLYFNNRGGFKLNNVLAQREQTTKIINELARRKNISISGKDKKRKRKPKSKGKHRKKKGVKSTEITIDNQPTQQVRGYSVVNVISAKRGPYKKRDRGLSGQEPIGNFNYRGKKGAFGQGSRYDNSQFTGLVKGSSDDRYRGDPQDKETIRGLRRDVDILQRRLAQPPQPPQQPPQPGPPGPAGPQGPPGPQGPAGAPAPQRFIPQQPPQRFTPKQQPKKKPQSPPRPPANTPRPKKVVYNPPQSPLLRGLLIEEAEPSASEEQKQLAKELNIPLEKVMNMTDMEFMTLLSQLPQQSSPPPPKPTISPTIGSAISAALGYGPAPAPQPETAPLSLELKSEESTPRTPRTTPSAPRPRGTFATIPTPLTLASPPVSVPSTPLSNPLGTIGSSPTLLALKGQSTPTPAPRRFNPPPTKRYARKRDKSFKNKSDEINRLQIERASIGETLRGVIPDEFYMKGKTKSQYLSKSKFPQLKEWSKTNLGEGGFEYISGKLDDWNVLFTKEKEAQKKFDREKISGGSAGGELYTLPENPVTQPEAEGPEEIEED